MNSPDLSTRGLFGWRDPSSLQLLLLVIVLGLSVWMIFHMRKVVKKSQDPQIDKNNMVQEMGAAKPAPGEMPKPRERPFIGYDASNEMLPETARDLFQEACAVLRRVISSRSTALSADCVRHPSITMPRARAMPLSRQAEPELPLSIGPKFGVTGDLLLTTVRMIDGTDRALVLEKTAEGYKLDWESYIAWCECDFATLKTHVGLKVHPRLMRVLCQPTDYRPPFAGEKGLCLVISHPAEKETLSAFVPEVVLKQSTAARELRDAKGSPFTLRLSPDRETIQHGWVRVDEVICSGWVTDH